MTKNSMRETQKLGYLSLQMDYYSYAFYAFYLDDEEKFENDIDENENEDERIDAMRDSVMYGNDSFAFL